MKWSYKLGRFLGIDVHIHATFLLLLGFIGLSHWAAGQGAAGALSGMLFFGGIFLCVLLHEYGHALMARRFGIGTEDITLLPFGGVARLERMPDRPAQELWVALAGPAVNVVIAALLAGILAATESWEPLAGLGPAEGSMIERLMAVNIFLVLFNLLPAFPMDGGRVFRALLALKLDYARATRIAATTGKFMAGGFALLGLAGNPMLFFIAFFVWMGATQEVAAAELKSGLAGATVRDAMVSDFAAISPDATLNDVSLLVLSGTQEDFPVVEKGRLAGLLTHGDILEAIRVHGPEEKIARIMRSDCATAEEDELLDEVLGRMQAAGGIPLPVLRNGRLTGILTAGNIEEYYQIRAARAARRMPPPLPRPALRLPVLDTRHPSRS